MKISCICLNSNLINTLNQSEIIDFIKVKMYEIGENISLISYFGNSYEKLKNELSSDIDITFIIGTQNSLYNHNIKENLCKIFCDSMKVFSNVKQELINYTQKYNIDWCEEDNLEIMLPSNCIPLYNSNTRNNGFMYKWNNKYIIFFPEDIDFVKQNYIDYISPLVNDINHLPDSCMYIKTFGIPESDLRGVLGELSIVNDITITINSNGLDSSIFIRYSSNSNIALIQDSISQICEKLNKYIYSIDNDDIYEMAAKLLKLQNKKITICETITMGEISKNLSKIDSNLIKDIYIYNNFNSVKSSLQLNPKVIEEYGEYSVNTVYELDNLLFEKSLADIYIFVLGNNEIDTCYIAIGDVDGIHVYKNKINSHSSKLIETISKTVIFYLIKKLRQNDLQFI